MRQSKKTNNFTALKFAKRLQGLSKPEKQAIVLIADACGTFGGVCTKKIATLAFEHGICERSLQYGIHGRHEGKSQVAGLLSRDLIYTEGESNGGGFYVNSDGKRTGFTTRWKLNPRSWMSYLSDEDAAEVWHLIRPHEGEHEGAHSEDMRVNILGRQGEHFQDEGEHFGSSGCTGCTQLPQREFPKENSPIQFPKKERKELNESSFSFPDQKTPTPVELVQTLFLFEAERPLRPSAKHKDQIEALIKKEGLVVVLEAVRLCASDSCHNWSNPNLEFPCAIFLTRADLPAYIERAKNSVELDGADNLPDFIKKHLEHLGI